MASLPVVPRSADAPSSLVRFACWPVTALSSRRGIGGARTLSSTKNRPWAPRTCFTYSVRDMVSASIPPPPLSSCLLVAAACGRLVDAPRRCGPSAF